jgi:hypothetical protein
MSMFRQTVAAFVCAALVTTGCASASGPRMAQGPAAPNVQDRAVLAEYVQRLPAGSRVRVERASGESLRGTLMKATPDSIVVQKNTRLPEAPVDVPLSDVTRVTLDATSSSLGKHIAIGVGSGVAATFGVLLILAALWSD